jgi:hypothetical protein
VNQALISVEDTVAKIANGRPLLLAGDEQVLRQLPSGNWIGGTIPYFMTEHGGLFSQTRVFVTELPQEIASTRIITYDESTIANVYRELPDNGFGIIILPAFSAVHLSFALNAPNYSDFATKPLIGWVSGVMLEDIARTTAKVFDGRTGTAYDRQAVVLQATMPPHKAADIGIINIFRQGDGDTLTFPETGFSITEVIVNGTQRNFAEYLTEQQLDTRLPLVANYGGAMVNVSIQRIDDASKTVHFYAPIFRGAEYRHARPVENYVNEFTAQIPNRHEGDILLSCNCILNYMYSELEGKQTDPFCGPCTFGEVAYQLLNQTMTYLTVVDIGD